MVDNGTRARGKKTLDTNAWLATSDPDARVRRLLRKVHATIPLKLNRK